mmetsp:Transcript_110356/g.356202  ORF Transcript_110356/g.356202 Transcript_110356/m.356202 type:complete len:231 (-) Transcript_110356:170-862(-)
MKLATTLWMPSAGPLPAPGSASPAPGAAAALAGTILPTGLGAALACSPAAPWATILGVAACLAASAPGAKRRGATTLGLAPTFGGTATGAGPAPLEVVATFSQGAAAMYLSRACSAASPVAVHLKFWTTKRCAWGSMPMKSPTPFFASIWCWPTKLAIILSSAPRSTAGGGTTSWAGGTTPWKRSFGCGGLGSGTSSRAGGSGAPASLRCAARSWMSVRMRSSRHLPTLW